VGKKEREEKEIGRDRKKRMKKVRRKKEKLAADCSMATIAARKRKEKKGRVKIST